MKLIFFRLHNGRTTNDIEMSLVISQVSRSMCKYACRKRNPELNLILFV
jgi:hypothetical protein